MTMTLNFCMQLLMQTSHVKLQRVFIVGNACLFFTAPADYESVAESFVFTPTSATTMCVNITIIDDGVGEGVETLSILLSSDSDNITLGRNAQVFLRDTGECKLILGNV